MSKSSLLRSLEARLVAELVYRPVGPVRPSFKKVMKLTSGEVGFDLRKLYRSTDWRPFPAKNGSVDIPAEIHRVRGAKGVAILSHGYGQNRYVLLPQAKLFWELGYSTVLFDQRHFGESKAESSTFGKKEAEDLLTLVRLVREQEGPDASIVLLGVSMGAMAVMNAMPKAVDADAFIEDCGPASLEDMLDPFYEFYFHRKNPAFRRALQNVSGKAGAPMEENRPVDAVAASGRPLLVIHGGADALVPLSQGEAIYKASTNSFSRLQVFPGREHALSIQDMDLYRDVLKEFLDSVERSHPHEI